MIGRVSANWGSAFPEGILTKENKIRAMAQIVTYMTTYVDKQL